VALVLPEIPFAGRRVVLHLVPVDYHEQFASLLAGTAPVLVLAPMQDVTDLPFWKLMTAYGGADVYFTEYFRVHSTSTLEKWILKSITENPTGRPIVAQMIGNDIPSLVRTARELQQYPIAAVDLNLGCPAPVVYRKCAGGGLLREPERVDAILGALRDAVKIKFTVKTRIGFDSPAVFDEFLPIFAKHSLDLLTVHGRTVYEMYRTEVRQRGETLFIPRGCDVLDYVRALYGAVCSPDVTESAQVQKMKKYMNYVGVGIDAEGQFLHQIRRVTTQVEFFRVCDEFLNHDRPMPLEPFPLKLKETDLMATE
jgi:tRNA-dihydrouridine synthase